MNKFKRLRDIILSLTCLLIFALGTGLAFLGPTSVIYSQGPAEALNPQTVVFTGGKANENSKLIVTVVYYDRDLKQYVELETREFLGGTDAAITWNFPEYDGYQHNSQKADTLTTLIKGQTRITLVYDPIDYEPAPDETAYNSYFKISNDPKLPAEQPTEPSKTDKPTEPSKTDKPTEPSKTDKPTEPSKTDKPTEPSKTDKPTEPSKTDKPTEPSKTDKPTEPSKTDKPTEPSKTDKPTEPSKTDKPTEPSKTDKPTEPSKTDEPTEPSEKPTFVEAPTDSKEEAPEIVDSGGVELSNPDTFDPDKAKKSSLYLEIYYLDKDGNLKKFGSALRMVEGKDGQKYLLTPPELKGYKLISGPLEAHLSGTLKAGSKRISLVYQHEELKMSEAEIEEKIKNLLDADGHYKVIEEPLESEETKPTESQSEATTTGSEATTTATTSSPTESSSQTESSTTKPRPTESQVQRPTVERPPWPRPPIIVTVPRPDRPVQPRPPVIGSPVIGGQRPPTATDPPVNRVTIEKQSGSDAEGVDPNAVQFETKFGQETTAREMKTLHVEQPEQSIWNSNKLFLLLGVLLGAGVAAGAVAIIYLTAKKD